MADTEQPQDTTPESGGKAPETPAGKPHDGERRFTQAELDALIEDRLRRDREKRERDATKERETAEAQRLREQQEYKTLADQHEARVKELEPQAEQATRYEAALKKHLEAARKDLPAHITELLDQLDVAAQLEWISAHQADLAKPVNGMTGVPGTPRAAGAPNAQDRETHYQQRIVSTGAYDHL